jgi:hypothetical protein
LSRLAGLLVNRASLPPPDYYDINGLFRCSLIQNDLEIASANVTMPSDQIIDLAHDQITSSRWRSRQNKFPANRDGTRPPFHELSYGTGWKAWLKT